MIMLGVEQVGAAAMTDLMPKKQIFLTMSAERSPILGQSWKITARKSGFYIQQLGQRATFHLSVHTPHGRHKSHRFHVRADETAIDKDRRNCKLVAHSIPDAGFTFKGKQVEDNAWLVVRLRWTWHMQRLRYRDSARGSLRRESVQNIAGPDVSALSLTTPLAPNGTWDIDLYMSYGRPFLLSGAFWRIDDSARLGPLHSSSDTWLTGLSWHRRELTHPTPVGISLPLPMARQEPNRILACGPGNQGSDDFYWFVQTITSKDVVMSMTE